MPSTLYQNIHNVIHMTIIFNIILRLYYYVIILPIHTWYSYDPNNDGHCFVIY